jgi:hypothetical protein
MEQRQHHVGKFLALDIQLKKFALLSTEARMDEKLEWTGGNCSSRRPMSARPTIKLCAISGQRFFRMDGLRMSQYSGDGWDSGEWQVASGVAG